MPTTKRPATKPKKPTVKSKSNKSASPALLSRLPFKSPAAIVIAAALALVGVFVVFQTLAATNTVIYKGTLNKNNPTRTYSFTTSGGVVNATLSSAKTKGLILTMKNKAGSTVAVASAGTSTSAKMSPTVPADTYTLTVSLAGTVNRNNFTLKIVYPVPDPAAPTVLITSPTNTELSGTTTLAASVTGGTTAPTAVDLAINSTLVISDNAAPYSTTYDTTKIANGDYTLTATAKYADGTQASSSIPITVSNTTVTPPPPTGGISTCNPAKGLADELCWYNNTGVLNTTTTANQYDRWTAAQIRSGAAAAQIQNVGSAASPAHVVLSTPGQTYSNKNVVGCINIQADNVTVENVHLTIDTSAAGCPYAGITTHPDGSGATMRKGFTLKNSEVDGGYSTACAIPPWNGNACPEVFNIANMPMNLIGPMKLDQVNVHGGYAFIGYMAGSQIVNSYLHDWGHMHKPCFGQSGCDDYHHDIIWAQGQSNWSMKHSFGLGWHTWPGRFGESGGCLCNNNSSNWAFIDSYMNGWANVDIAGGNGTKSKIVALNVYGAGTSAGNIWQAYPYSGSTPTAYPDYGAGAWAENYALNPTYGQMIPVIDHSRCTGVYSVTTAGAATKVGC